MSKMPGGWINSISLNSSCGNIFQSWFVVIFISKSLTTTFSSPIIPQSVPYIIMMSFCLLLLINCMLSVLALLSHSAQRVLLFFNQQISSAHTHKHTHCERRDTVSALLTNTWQESSSHLLSVMLFSQALSLLPILSVLVPFPLSFTTKTHTSLFKCINSKLHSSLASIYWK